jgi:hypothetical protein
MLYLIVFVLGTAAAQGATPQPNTTQAPPQRGNCVAADHHQLDFWIGQWIVYDKANDNTQVGTSRVESVMNGCGIAEHYEAPAAPGGAYSGASYSAFDRNDGHWHQFYVDVNGNATWYTGGLQGTDIVMTAAGRKGSLQKMTYHPVDDGSVEQTGMASTDRGKTWNAGYDYIYRKP